AGVVSAAGNACRKQHLARRHLLCCRVCAAHERARAGQAVERAWTGQDPASGGAKRLPVGVRAFCPPHRSRTLQAGSQTICREIAVKGGGLTMTATGSNGEV